MQCKDIEDRPLLEFIAVEEYEKGYGVNEWDFEPPYSDLPKKLLRAKMGQLLKRDLIDGCNCGCRGDYTMQDKGWQYLGFESKLHWEADHTGVAIPLLVGVL
jgi:hypothetical protein